jgi:hypothetical protein
MKKTFLFPVIIMAAMMANCGKKYDPAPNPVPAGSNDLTLIMASLAPKPQTVTLDAATGGTFRGKSGTRYEFPANAFVTATGSPVTGDVAIKVTEFLTKSAMLYSSVFPMSNGEPLISGGEIEVTASQGGQELRMAPGAKYRASMPMPGTDATGMIFFTGTKNGDVVAWKPVDTGSHSLGTIFTLGDTIGISSSTLNFGNADRFMSNPNYQDFTIVINAGGVPFSHTELSVYAFYDGYKTVWPIYGANDTGNIYHEHHVPEMPVHFLAMGSLGGNLYSGILAASPKTGGTYTIILNKTTSAQLKEHIEAL